MAWIKYLDNGIVGRGWPEPRWCIGPVQDNEDVNCGVFTTRVLSSWSDDREALKQVGDPIRSRLEFIKRIRESLEAGKLHETEA
jgi:hypothetical protein